MLWSEPIKGKVNIGFSRKVETLQLQLSCLTSLENVSNGLADSPLQFHREIKHIPTLGSFRVLILALESNHP